MGKHSRHSNKAISRTAGITALSIGASAALASNASADEVTIPHTDIRVNVDGLNQALNNVPELPRVEVPTEIVTQIKQAVPNIADVPGVSQWIPEVLEQGRQANYAAFAEIPAAARPTEGQRIVDIAATKIGAPYAWGATGPNAFDCSGLTSWAYAQVGKHIPRTSYAQAASGTPVAYQDLQAGDIVAFYSGATHVGIYTGHGTVINAIDYGTPLGETSLDHMPFHSAVRY